MLGFPKNVVRVFLSLKIDLVLVNSSERDENVSMVRKYHKLHRNPRHCEEELQDIYGNKTSKIQ